MLFILDYVTSYTTQNYIYIYIIHYNTFQFFIFLQKMK